MVDEDVLKLISDVDGAVVIHITSGGSDAQLAVLVLLRSCEVTLGRPTQ